MGANRDRLSRNYRIAIDYVHGKTVAQLAAEYDISPGRVHQIYVEAMTRMALMRYDRETQAIRMLEHLRQWESRDRAKRNTPAYFYYHERGQLDW